MPSFPKVSITDDQRFIATYIDENKDTSSGIYVKRILAKIFTKGNSDSDSWQWIGDANGYFTQGSLIALKNLLQSVI